MAVVPNGIDPPDAPIVTLDLPRRSAGEVRIGYFGRLSPEKGVAGLLEALASLTRVCPECRTLIVGDGPQRTELEELARRLGLVERVRFLGFRTDARAIMEQVDVVVHTPLYEGFGIVVLEAMAAGRPVVANDAPGGIAEMVIHRQTGLVAPAGSSAAVVEALARLARDPAERRRLGQNGRARYEQQFSARAMAERTAAVYRRVLPGVLS
jgi:glycosyltransferase involved in cell wall biosynthesis